MLVVRCTAKLLRKLPEPPVEEPPPSTGRLGDWYANILHTRPVQLVLLVNEPTRLSVVLPAREFATLWRRIPDAIAEVLALVGIDANSVEGEHRLMRDVVFARTASRSVVGTMTDFAFQLECIRESEPGASYTDLALELAHTPVSTLRHGFPVDVARRVLSVPTATST